MTRGRIPVEWGPWAFLSGATKPAQSQAGDAML